MTDKSKTIAKLNDEFRKAAGTAAQIGRIFKTHGIASLPIRDQVQVLELVRTFNDFAKDDPYGEHDFGSISHNGEKIFWKIDYYDQDGEQGSEDPSDPDVTTRVLTVMLAHEW